MPKEKIKELSELLFQFRSAFVNDFTTEERNALAKTILTVEFRVGDEEVEILSPEDRPRW